MLDGGLGISLATSSLFSLKFIPLGRKKAVLLKNLTAVQDLKLPEQEQQADSYKSQFAYLRSVSLPSYTRQAPQIMLGLSNTGLMAHLT